MATCNFTDSRAFVVQPSDRRLAGHWTDDQAGFEQSDDGPIFVVIGRHAPKAKVDMLAQRFNLCPAEIAKVRHAALRRAGKAALRFVGIERFLVRWLRNGKQCDGPWFYSRERAHQARALMASKYGRAIVWAD